MSTDHLDHLDTHAVDPDEPSAPTPAAPEVTVRRNGVLGLVVLVVALLLGVAYLVRGLGGGGLGAWLPAVLLLALAVHQALVVRDARTPLLVADDLGIRLRLGGTWRGLPWTQVRQVVVEPRTSLVHDGRLLVEPLDPDSAFADLGPRAVRDLRLSRQVYGGPLVVPLGMTTAVRTPGGAGAAGLVDDLVELADGRARVVEVAGQMRPEAPRGPEGPGSPGGPDGPRGDAREPQAQEEPVDQWSDEPFDQEADDRPTDETRNRVGAGLTASFGTVRNRLAAATRIGSPEAQAVLEDFEPEVVPLIGPRLREARERVGLGVAEVSGRTRIRAHVIEAMEEEDFAPCGGDFYARGHLRTLAAVLGLDAEELLADFDAAYAHEPVSASTVLSAGGGADRGLGARLSDAVRATVQGPRWSVVAAVALCLVLAWSVARFATGGTEEAAAPRGDESAQLASGAESTTTRAVLRSPERATRVVVRDASGDVVYRGRVVPGKPQRVQGSGALTVRVDRAASGDVLVTRRDARWDVVGSERPVVAAPLVVG